MSLTSCRLVVAIQSFPLRDEQALVLSLFPVESGEPSARQPRLDRRAQRGLALEPSGERHVAELHTEARTELAQRTKLIQLEQAVDPVAARRPLGDDQLGRLQVTQH